jgi:uroporphyrin-3 C-methyltransferase
MNDPLPPAPPPSAAGPAPPRRAHDREARVIGALALVVAALFAWLAWDARTGVRNLESSAGGRMAELGAESSQSRAALAQVQSGLREAQARIAELEARIADTQEQRVALEEMYRELSRSADDRVLSEVEQMLVLASQQLQLAGNVRGALAALQAADQRLARAEKLAAAPLRRAIAQDMERLKAVPSVDTVGIAVKLDGLIAQADTLPLPIAEAAGPRNVARARPLEENGATRVARDFWDEMKSLVRIREIETSDTVLLAPSQSYFLRENLKLRLLAARMALVARDEATFREDLRAAQASIAKYFDPKAKSTIAAVAGLKQIAESPISIALPDINASLAAVRTARSAREKGR